MEGIKVFIRIRPLSVNKDWLHERDGKKSVTRVSECNKEISINAPSRQVRCRYDHVFGPTSTQDEVYDHVKSSVDSVLQGINSTIFAYGQTSSGKTHTMFGKESCIFDEPGIVPRCIHDIFRFAVTNQIQSFSVYVSFIQVYNDQIYDMLDDAKRTKPLGLHETPHLSNITISGLTEYQVHSYKQCLSLIELGLKNRTIRETNMNHVSSRSHSILQITIEQSRIDESKVISSSLCSKLNLVDLAGSERWTANGGRGKGMGNNQISELTNINSSLYTLGRCIAALAKRSQMDRSAVASPSCRHIHIPFRDSKLTRLLQDSLGGNSKTYLVATVNPSLSCSDESISTLRFADRAHQVMTFAEINEEVKEDKSEVKALRLEILRLQRLLRINGIQDNDMLNTNHKVSNKIGLSKETSEYDNYEKKENTVPIQNKAQHESNWSETTISVSQHESNINGQHHDSCCKLDVGELKNTSVTNLQRKTCEKIVNALGTVLVAVDSFLKNLNINPTTIEVERKSESPSLEKYQTSLDLVDNDYIKKNVMKWKSSSTPLSINTPKIRDDVDTDKNVIKKNIAKETETSTLATPARHQSHSFKGKSLSSLLKQRRKLQGFIIEEDEEDLRLKEELKRARKHKEQKLQLREWLLEKETKAGNPQGTPYIE